MVVIKVSLTKGMNEKNEVTKTRFICYEKK